MTVICGGTLGLGSQKVSFEILFEELFALGCKVAQLSSLIMENPAANLSPQERDELMRTVQAQVALANMQELLSVSWKIWDPLKVKSNMNDAFFS